MCLICQPMCEKCQPKFVTCPTCGKRANIMFPACVFCKAPVTPEMKELALEEWSARKAKREEMAEKAVNG